MAQDILVEAASSATELSCNYLSGSGQHRCSLFGCAWVNEVTTHPDGRVTRHRQRIEEEMSHVNSFAGQETSTPQVITSTQSLYSHNMSHWVNSSTIAQAILQAASKQDQKESRLQWKAHALDFWGRFLRSLRHCGPGRTNNADVADLRTVIIRQCLEDLGPAASQGERSDLASVCQVVLRGGGDNELKDKTVNTTRWQEDQMVRVEQTLEHLVREGHLVQLFKPSTASKSLDHLGPDLAEVRFGIFEKFRGIPIVRQLLQPCTDRTFIISYQDAHNLLVNNIVCSRLMRPSRLVRRGRSYNRTFSERVTIRPYKLSPSLEILIAPIWHIQTRMVR